MANEQNLTPFKKGQSGNPAGKKKGTVSLVTKMREALDKIHDGTQEPYHILLVQSMMKDAIKTDGQSRRLFLQYLEGMPQQKLEHSGQIKTIAIASEILEKNGITSQTSTDSQK